MRHQLTCFDAACDTHVTPIHAAQGTVKQIVGSTLKDAEERYVLGSIALRASEARSELHSIIAADRRRLCHPKGFHNARLTHCSDGGDPQLITNFEAAAPASYFAELYARDGLHGGHVIMLGPDPESR